MHVCCQLLSQTSSFVVVTIAMDDASSSWTMESSEIDELPSVAAEPFQDPNVSKLII